MAMTKTKMMAMGFAMAAGLTVRAQQVIVQAPTQAGVHLEEMSGKTGENGDDEDEDDGNGICDGSRLDGEGTTGDCAGADPGGSTSAGGWIGGHGRAGEGRPVCGHGEVCQGRVRR